MTTEQPICSTKQTKPRLKPVRDIGDFNQVAVRNVIYQMYKQKKHITRKSLLQILKERNIFNGGISSLGKVLKDIGFHWQKCDPRRGLMELPHIALRQVECLQSYKRNLQSPTPSQFVFLDETWIFENGRTKAPRAFENLRVKENGNSNGFIPGASLIFSSNTKDPNYHGEMDSENFLKWFEDQLLRSLQEPSIIVIDNASYHSKIINKAPNSTW